VTVTTTAKGLNPRLHAIYSWSGDGVIGNGPSATVATALLAAGGYTVRVEVKEGKPGEEGLKPDEIASCSVPVVVKGFEPPTISCSVNPSTIQPGDKATITAVGVSTQSRPLTYSYSVMAGTVTGSGSTAVYSSVGAAPGAVGITCNVSDDKGDVASASTTVTILSPKQ